MADSRKELILKNIVTTLEGITIDNGYDFDMASVGRLPTSPFQLVDFPTVHLLDLSETKDEAGIATKVDVSLALQLVCWTYAFDGVSTEATNVLAGIEKALSVDRTRGGFAYDTDITGNETFVAQEAVPYGGITIFANVRYRHYIGDPFTGA